MAKTVTVADSKAAAVGVAVMAGDVTPGVAVRFKFSGTAGTPFNVDGVGFGSGGTLSVSGRLIPTTRWNDTSIKGVLPKDLKGGEIVITPMDGEVAGVVQKGTFKR